MSLRLAAFSDTHGLYRHLTIPDYCFENRPMETVALLTNCIYLFDEAIQGDGLDFYGSPWQPWFFKGEAVCTICRG